MSALHLPQGCRAGGLSALPLAAPSPWGVPAWATGRPGVGARCRGRQSCRPAPVPSERGTARGQTRGLPPRTPQLACRRCACGVRARAGLHPLPTGSRREALGSGGSRLPLCRGGAALAGAGSLPGEGRRRRAPQALLPGGWHVLGSTRGRAPRVEFPFAS